MSVPPGNEAKCRAGSEPPREAHLAPCHRPPAPGAPKPAGSRDSSLVGERAQGCLMEALANVRAPVRIGAPIGPVGEPICLSPFGWKSEAGTKMREASSCGSSPDRFGPAVTGSWPGFLGWLLEAEAQILTATAAGAGDDGARLVPRPGRGRWWPELCVSLCGLCPCECPVSPPTTSPACYKPRGPLGPLVFLHLKIESFKCKSPGLYARPQILSKHKIQD